MTALFDRVGLATNTTKTKAMAFLLGRIGQDLLDEAYLARINPEARAVAVARKVRCKLYQVELAAGSLASITPRDPAQRAALLPGGGGVLRGSRNL